MATYSIDPKLSKAFSRKYPRCASNMVEAFIAKKLEDKQNEN